MSTPFFKFPHTPHLAWLGPGQPRDDKVLSPVEAAAFLSHPILVEEKIDGANLGISFDHSGRPWIQNRASHLGPGCHPQFQPLWPWLALRQHQLYAELSHHLVLFGEWCFAKHSLHYNRLPDWFLAFDVYDYRENAFWSHRRRNLLLSRLSISPVPRLALRRFSLAGLQSLLLSTQSQCGDVAVEGLFLRKESPSHLLLRAKLVRPDFVQNIGAHWSSRPISKNSLA